MDFSKLDDAAQWQRLQSEIAGLDIGVLGEYMRYFDLLTSCPPFVWPQGSMPEPDFLTSISSTVNNAGKSYQYPEDFSACSEKDMEDIVTINVGSVVRLTRMVLPGMVERYA